jgi:ABC-type sulfate transport system permease component
MKSIRRFQRTFFTLLLGVNVLIFSNSFYGDFKAALWHSVSAMLMTACVLLLASSWRKQKNNRKKLILDREE